MQSEIREDVILGLDVGIASCGWALLLTSGSILAMGVRTWDAPETDKERTPTNQLRRQHRGMRRVLGRRRVRMNEVRRLFREHGLIETQGSTGLRIARLDPWALRAQGLDRRLTGPELAVALGHIAKHRGFKSNSKRDRGANAADDSSRMLKAIGETQEKLSRYRTVGEMFAKDEEFAGRKRNRDGEFTRSILRDDQASEVRRLFDAQRKAGNTLASEALETAFTTTAFFQRPVQDSEHLLGDCPFERDEKRAARRAPSFERFRFLSRLAALRITEGRQERALTPEEIALAEADFGRQKKVSYKTLRKLLQLAPDVGFAAVAEAAEATDFVARQGAAAEGTATLRDAIVGSAGEGAWRALLHRPEAIDAAAAVITFREDLDSIRDGLDALSLEPAVLAALMDAVGSGRMRAFNGAAHVSAKAARALLPHLREGKGYSEACAAAGYNHAERPEVDLTRIANPVARKALTESLKQVRAIVGQYGLPGAIHIELARDVGKGREEREEIRTGIERRNKEKERLRGWFRDDVGVEPESAEDLLRYELWREQCGRCLYTDQEIHPGLLVASDNTVQVDHILPWSRSGDDSFVNKTLCYVSANQDKRGETPWEWFGRNDEARWATFRALVESNKTMKGRKKRNYLLKDASVLTEKFRPRNLNDTRYATRLLLDALARMYPESDRFTGIPRKPEEERRRRRLFARPGPLTDRLRRAWGLQGLKKDASGQRIADDRHHALDALIVAATDEATLQRLTRAFQDAETRGLARDFGAFEPPWPSLREEAQTMLQRVFVSRAERRRARGEGHAQTVRRFEDTPGGHVVYERKAVDALTASDLARVKDPDRNTKLIAALQEWIDAGKPKDRRPLSPKGDAIAKVRLTTKKKVDVLVRDGAAERGEMVRVDVFRKQNRKGAWEYFLVPIYPHQVFDAKDWPKPPSRAVQAYADEQDWPEMTEDYEYMWAIHPFSLIEVETAKGLHVMGYCRGLHRSTGALSISPHHSRDDVTAGIGARTLKSFNKYQVDRLGAFTKVEREKRTWRGAVCT